MMSARHPLRMKASSSVGVCLCCLSLLSSMTVAFVPRASAFGGTTVAGIRKQRSSCVVEPKGRASSSSSWRTHDAASAAVAPMSMMFDTLADSMSNVASLFTGQKTITESSLTGALKEVKRALLDADVNLKVTNGLVEGVKEKAVGMKLVDGVTPEQQFMKVMNDELIEVMGAEQAPLARREDGSPTVILLAGLQGTGKTTAAAKLAKYLQNDQEAPQKVLLVAGDIYRPAAIDQLITLGKRIEVEVFSMGQGVDPVEITKGGLARAEEGGFDTVIIDTAGRQVVDDTLMAELKNIQVASKADEVLLVVDAMTGQEAATLASVFNEKIGITGTVLTKMDGDTRGGAALSVQGVSQKPIKFVGVGEKLDDLEPFYPDRMASRILGMGDVVTLVEKASKEMNEKEAEEMAKKMMSAEFDFNDFLKQSQMMKNMGSFGGVANMLPGMAGKLNPQQLNQVQEGVARAEMLISVMEPDEKRKPDLLISDPTAPARLRRIARDAGVKTSAVSNFLREFQSMQANMARMGKKMADQDPNKGTPEATFGSLVDEQIEERGLQTNRKQRRLAKKGKSKGGSGYSTGFG